ncbi:MAG: hypothetical protein SV377_03020 [Halobacteria archaeon]|nr:hypothetical protein [Halobacteria archaeon]
MATVPESHLEVLRKIDGALSESEVNWALTGSVGHALQGVPVEPDDIDIQTDESGVRDLTNVLSGYVTEDMRYVVSENMKSYLAELEINGIEVEVMGDVQKRLEGGEWEPVIDVNEHKKVVDVEGMEVPVLSLEYEYKAYKRLGRDGRAEMIKEVLNG